MGGEGGEVEGRGDEASALGSYKCRSQQQLVDVEWKMD